MPIFHAPGIYYAENDDLRMTGVQFILERIVMLENYFITSCMPETTLPTDYIPIPHSFYSIIIGHLGRLNFSLIVNNVVVNIVI